MAKKRSALERVRNNPKNVTAKDLQELLEDYGFNYRNASGDHYIFKKEGHRPITIPYSQNPIALFIVKEILQVIDSIIEE